MTNEYDTLPKSEVEYPN